MDKAVRVDEEVAGSKQDSPMELFPEPLLIILSPPPPFLPVPGEAIMTWDKWLKSFENYIEALGENELTDCSKCGLLQNCLGREGQRIFPILIQPETSYAATVATLTLYFNSGCTSQMYRLKFHQRAQMLGETVNQYVSALEDLLRPCNYGRLQDKLIVNQLIEKTNCPQVRERLLLEKETLTVERALAIGSEIESASNEYIHEVSVDIGDDLDPPVKRKRGRPRRGEKRARRQPKPQSTKAPRRPCKYKEEYYLTSDKLHDNNEEGPIKSAFYKTSETDNSNNETLSPLSVKIEVESCDRSSDGAEDADATADDDDKDFLTSPSKAKGPYCPICVTRQFRDANKLARHMRMHTKEKPFSCPLCSLTFSQSYHMTRHMRNQHGAGPHICSTCGESLGSYAELQIHKGRHKSQVVSCYACNEKFTNNDAYINHLSSHGKDPSTQTLEQSSYQSDGLTDKEIIKSGIESNENNVCNNNTTESDVDSGASDVQGRGSEVKVKTEDKESTEDKDATQGKSQDAHGKKGTSKTKSKGHFCPICVGRRFRGPNKLARHMRTHTKEKPFSCPVCALTFSQSYHMTRHLRNQHNLGEYVCSKCGKSLNSWLELRAHKKAHAVEGVTCLACDKQFKNKAALVSHLKIHQKVQSSSPKSLTCGDCGKVFHRMYHLKRHIVTHRKELGGECYSCPDCKKKFAFPEDLNKHLQIHLKENNGTCPKCNETFGSQEELEAHVKVHEKSYSCNTCGKKFKVEYALKKHEKRHQNEQYYCSLCRKHFIKLSHYKRHSLVHRRRETKCPHCDSVFLKVTAFKYHLRTHKEERPYQCSCCIETFEEKEDLEQHCLRHRKFRKERPYSCTRCDYAFSTLVELTEHMSSHEGEQPLNCPICGKTFLNKNKLEKHLTIHTGERPHLCSICGNGFPSAASLKLHGHIHTGEKPFQCSQCGKTFRSSSGLRLHSRQHMEVRPSYKCPECGRTYGRMTELKMHQRYHTGDKPFACTCCNKRFISKDKLNVHMRIHTGERPYSCHVCGQTFTQTGDRNRHISKFHLDADVPQLQ